MLLELLGHQAGQRRWLWAGATKTAACYVISIGRGLPGLLALLGDKMKGILCSDRWSVYGCWKTELRQVCWAHLKRDFQKLVDRGGVAKKYGKLGQAAAHILFHEWHLYRGGGSRAQLQRELEPIRATMREWLEQGTRCRDPKTAAFCQNLLDLEPALWTFLYRKGVEPTNNHGERIVRTAVLWSYRRAPYRLSHSVTAQSAVNDYVLCSFVRAMRFQVTES